MVSICRMNGIWSILINLAIDDVKIVYNDYPGHINNNYIGCKNVNTFNKQKGTQVFIFVSIYALQAQCNSINLCVYSLCVIALTSVYISSM